MATSATASIPRSICCLVVPDDPARPSPRPGSPGMPTVTKTPPSRAKDTERSEGVQWRPSPRLLFRGLSALWLSLMTPHALAPQPWLVYSYRYANCTTFFDLVV